MKSPTEIHSNSAIELQVSHVIIISVSCLRFPGNISFPLQEKRICGDSSFVTLMSFSAKLSLPARFFSHRFGSHGRTLNYSCNRLRTAKRYVTWLVSNHDRSNHDRRIMSEGLIYKMICVQVQVNYSICNVDCVQLAQGDKIVVFLTHEILKLICGHINYCLYCRLIVNLT